ncbi:unnamed protein product [Symbiodinium necroappetens]|uniref:Uncharacterized protein n=1 Tax=Symbiodinium necroappetens TaxID=1628268 RepID=A0A812Y0W4_9DINO|nr:unnamed protein product [Symbiodinium necroappetens]
MPPKKDKKSKKAGAAETSYSLPAFYNPNAAWHAEVEESMDVLRGAFGVDLKQRPALSEEDGFAAPLDLGLAKTRLADGAWTGQVLASGGVNVLWDSPLTTMTGTVAVNKMALERWMKNQWSSGPRPLRDPVDFRIVSGGALERVSPEEPVQALVVTVARRVRAGASQDELQLWLKVMFSASGRIVKAESSIDAYFWGVNFRRGVKDESKAVCHLASQVAADVWLFKKRLEAQHARSFTYEEIADFYAQHMSGVEDDDEPRSDPKLIEKAVTVYEHVLVLPEVRAIIQRMDEYYNDRSPFNAINNLLEVHYKCKTPQRVLWIFQSIETVMAMETLEPSELARKPLLKPGSGKISLLEVFLCKKGMKEFFVGRFLDTRSVDADYKAKLREIFQNPTVYRDSFLIKDRSQLSSWPTAVSHIVELIEGACFNFDHGDANIMKTGIKQGKTPQEIAEEYNPWQKLIAEIDKELAAPGAASTALGDAGQVIAAEPKAAAADATSIVPKLISVNETGVDLATVDEGWMAYVDRALAKSLVLVTEKGLSQSQLRSALEAHSLATCKGTDSGTVLVYFDSNTYGESITAPHLRMPPLQESTVKKLYSAVKNLREDKDTQGILPPGDCLVILDGGRRRSTSLLNLFQMGADRVRLDKSRKHKDGKVVARELIVHFTEASALARRFRQKLKTDTVSCAQKAFIFHSGLTKLAKRPHKHFQGMTNLASTLGPFSWPAVSSLPMLSVADKRTFWEARRRAVGGPTVESGAGSLSSSDAEASDASEPEPDVSGAGSSGDAAVAVSAEAAEAADDLVEVPAVGQGRGSGKTMADTVMQPICWHQPPRLVADSLCHMCWAKVVIDLTPATGDLAIDSVLEGRGYVGVCHSDFQRELIATRVKKAFIDKMSDPNSKVYSVAYANEYGTTEATTAPNKKLKPEAPKKDPAAKTKPKPGPKKGGEDGQPTPVPKTGTSDLGDKLQAMLAAAKLKKG